INVDMTVLGFGKRLDLLDILGRIRATYYHIGYIVFTYQLRRLSNQYSCWLIWHTQSLCQMSCSRVPSPSGLPLSLTARGSFLTLREFRLLCSTVPARAACVGVRGQCA